MYDIIYQIIGHTWEQTNNMQQYIVYVCSALIIVLTVVFIDMVIRILFRVTGLK